MKRIKNIIFTIFLMGLIILVYINLDGISNFINNYLIDTRKVVILDKNDYARNYDYLLFTYDEDYKPYTIDDIKNIYFNVLNNGWEKFIFYCPREYTTCLDDVKIIGHNESLLSKINDYVHPYNSFEKVNTTVASNGEITIEVDKKYTDEMIKTINDKVDRIINELFDKELTIDEKIVLVHNYIINNVKYDKNEADGLGQNKNSTSAYGSLIEGLAVCSGYADAFAIFLDKLNVPNLKISSDNHVWNLVKLNDKYLHADLTWDDVENPRYKNNYFLITTEELLTKDKDEHNFDKDFFLEAS